MRCLERRAGGQRRPARLRRHSLPICACESCPESGIVLSSAEDCSVALWRSAACMAAKAEAAELGRLFIPADGTSSYAWILPPSHLSRLRAGPLYRLRRADVAPADVAAEADAAAAAYARDESVSSRDDGEVPSAAALAAARAWRGPSALVVLVARLPDAAPQCATATLWEFPLPSPPPFAAAVTAADRAAVAALPPPTRVALWRDVFAGPPPPENADEADEDDRVGVIGPTLCRRSALLAVITPDGGVALRDLCTGAELQPASLREARASQLRNVVCDEHAGAAGAKQLLLESREQQMSVIDVEADAPVCRFTLPRTQLPIMYSDRVAAWLPPASRHLITGEAVNLAPYGRAINDANALRVATRRDGAWVVADRDAEVAAAAAAREAPWLAHDTPCVVLYRLWDCCTGRVVARVALPALRGEADGGPLAWNGNVVTLDALTPGQEVFSALVLAPEPTDAKGRASGALHLWRSSDGAMTKLPDGAALRPRQTDPPPNMYPHAGGVGQFFPEIGMMHPVPHPQVPDGANWAEAAAAIEQLMPGAFAAAFGGPQMASPPFQLGLTEAVSWRWAVVAEYAAGGNALHAPGSLLVLDMLGSSTASARAQPQQAAAAAGAAARDAHES